MAHEELDARELMIRKLEVCLVQGRTLRAEIDFLNRQVFEFVQRTQSSLSGSLMSLALVRLHTFLLVYWQGSPCVC